MLSLFRFAAILTVISAVCGAATAEGIGPSGSGVTIDKQVIDNGTVHTVKYFVKGGSPRLQALVRRVEWAENELSVIEQLQLLKLDTVVNERRIATFRTAQLTNPYYLPGGYFPPAIPVGDSKSSLQRALTWQLAYEATPQAALQLIGLLEQMQTDLDAELKALPPKEKKAAQGPVDALRERVAALPRADVPPPPPQPSSPGALAFPPVYQQQLGPTGAVAAPVGSNAAIEVEWRGAWYPAEVTRVDGALTQIHYTGWASSWDEWVPANRIRPAAAVTALPQLPTPQNPAAFRQTVLQNQEKVRRQIAQKQQQMRLPPQALTQPLPTDPAALQQMVRQQFALVQQQLMQRD